MSVAELLQIYFVFLGPSYGAIAVPSVTRCRCCCRCRCRCGHRCAGGVRQWRRATVATPGEWQCKIRTGVVRRLAVANGPNIFQMLLVWHNSCRAKSTLCWLVLHPDVVWILLYRLPVYCTSRCTPESQRECPSTYVGEIELGKGKYFSSIIFVRGGGGGTCRKLAYHIFIWRYKSHVVWKISRISVDKRRSK